VDDISPDFIARLASRIYNESPNGDGAPTAGSSTASAAAPTAPSIPATPTEIPSHLGSLPFSFSSLPHASILPGVSNVAPEVSAPSMPPTPSANAPANTGFSLPSVPSALMPVLPGNTPAAAPEGASGLSAFVAKIRQTHFSGRDQQLGFNLRQTPEHSGGSSVIPATGARPFDVPAIREDFPILRQKIHGKPIAWLDNAATTQKPQSVIDAISRFYQEDYSNIHRGAHTLAARATDAYEKAREKVQTFLGAASSKEIVFVRGTTEGINLVAQTYGKKFLQSGDEILLTTLEHHANIVPWQMVAKEKGAVLRVAPVNDRGEIMLEDYQKLLGPRTKVVAISHASNSLGTILPVMEMTQMAKRHGARVLIDGAQSVAHIPVNVQQLGADFYVFSGHKIFGPSGIGAVYIKEELHDILPPWQGGGSMIRNVTFEESTYSDVPAKFEAGTPNITDAVGLGAALDYVSRLGLPNIAAYEHRLLEYATEALCRINGLRLIGTAREKVGVLSFVLPNRRTQEVGRYLDQEGIAVRAGHHCSQPALRRFGLESTVRPSLAFYNTTGEIDRLVDAIKRLQTMP
jgi:cysteine desulfurase / selenocysteine lyase